MFGSTPNLSDEMKIVPDVPSEILHPPAPTHDLEALKQLRHLRFGNAADLQHFLRPALVLHVEQQHTGSVGIIAGVNAGEPVRQVVLREHDLRDFFEIFRLVFAHPEELRRRKARKSDVCRQL